MTAPAPIRPTRMAPTFLAWRVGMSGQSYVLGLYASLDEAVNAAGPECQHKDQMVVLEDAGGRKVAHFYAVQRGKPVWRHNYETKQPERLAPLKLAPLFAMKVDAFEPTLAFDWSRDRDTVGAGTSVLEQRP